MRKYELMFIVRPNLESQDIKKTADEFQKFVKKQKVKNLEMSEMGQKELAYLVEGYKTGFYFLMTFETDNFEVIEEINRIATISEDIIRHLIVKVEE